jgi:spore maturation protein CgeB
VLEKVSRALKLTVAGPSGQFRELPLARCLGPVDSKEEINLLFNRAKMVLGFDRLVEEVAVCNRKPHQVFSYSDVTHQVKDRSTCVLASGACYFVEDHPENRRLFQDGEDLVLWKDADDLVEKLKRYANDPAERARIGENGRRRVMGGLSVAARAKQMIARFEALRSQ